MRSLAAAGLSLVLLASCSAPPPPEADVSKGQVRADMKEYLIGLTAPEVRSGTVTLIARNAGSTAHDIQVLRTDIPPDKLQIDPQTQKAKEDGKIGGLDQIAPGKSQNLRLELPPGSYVVICNVPTHYQLGMRTTLHVR